MYNHETRSNDITERNPISEERPTCETCEYWDGEIQPAICKRYPRPVGHVSSEVWCGEHPGFPRWIEQQGEKQ